MTDKFNNAFMETAYTFSKLSTAKKLKVGAVIVKDKRIISIGYNGTPSGWDNNCEDLIQYSDDTTQLKTKPIVIHAESNAISKLASSHESGINSTMYITHMPCMECAKLIYQSGISEIYYSESYRSTDGIDFLEKCGVNVKHLEYKMSDSINNLEKDEKNRIVLSKYYSDDFSKTAEIVKYDNHYSVECFTNDSLTKEVLLKGYSLSYAEDTAENWVFGILKPD